MIKAASILFSSITTLDTRAGIGILILRFFYGLAFCTVFEKFLPVNGTWGPQPWFIEDVARMGFIFPSFFAWCAVLSEFIGGILLILGLATRIAALLNAVVTFVAFALYHQVNMLGQGLPAVLMFVAMISICITGPGKFSFDYLLWARLQGQKTNLVSKAALLVVGVLLSFAGLVQGQSLTGQVVEPKATGQYQEKNKRLRLIPAQALKQDFILLKTALTKLHPGLYRYIDSVTVEKHFAHLAEELNHEQNTVDVYLSVSRFLAKLQCGHTYANFYNQPEELEESVFALPDKVPFTFFLVEKRMFIDKNLSEKSQLTKGMEVLSINGVSVTKMIDSLLLYVKGDGNNLGQRLHSLQLSGLGKHEAFDVLSPLLFPPKQQGYELLLKDALTEKSIQVSVMPISRQQRVEIMGKRYGKQLQTPDELWEFKLLDQQTAYLKAGSFVTGKMQMNWKAFLKNSFRQISDQQIQNLIIDIRDNEGGDDEVSLEIARYLAYKPLSYPQYKQLLVYEKVDAELKPYLQTWENGFYDRSGKLIKAEGRFLTWKRQATQEGVKENKNAFQGKIYLLINAANSSATFMLAKAMRENKLAILVGEQTGGNEKGITAGQLFFLHLPHSKVEIDIPLIGYYPLSPKTDSGLLPDIAVGVSADDYLGRKDKALEVVLNEIAKQGIHPVK